MRSWRGIMNGGDPDVSAKAVGHSKEIKARKLQEGEL